MIKIKKYITACGVALIILLGAAYSFVFANNSNSGSGEYDNLPVVGSTACMGSFNSMEELYNSADLVVIASPIDEFSQREIVTDKDERSFGGFSDYYAIGDYSIIKTIKGVPDKEQIRVAELTVISKIIGSNYTVMEKGREYVLFLAEVEELDAYSTLCLEYGKYNIDGLDLEEEKHITKDKAPDVFSIKQEVLNNFANN